MNIKKYWMMLTIALVSLCTISCGGDDEDSPSNGGGNNGNGGNTNTEVAVTGTVAGITDNSAQITGTVYLSRITISYSSIEYGVQLATDINFNSSIHMPASTLANNIFTTTATGLSPETTYWYRTYVNVQNTSYYGQTLTFTTEKASAKNLTCSDSSHPHMIDLGLPSGTMWACCNVGASKPEDFGDYYAWGEIWTKSQYTSNTYDYNDGGDFRNIGSDISREKYDVAYEKWGKEWCMPSASKMQELIDYTTSTWAVQEGVNGRTFTGSNGGKIFLPAAGDYVWRQSDGGSYGNYWSSTIAGANQSWYASNLFFKSDELSVLTEPFKANYRHTGCSVRPVRTK